MLGLPAVDVLAARLDEHVAPSAIAMTAIRPSAASPVTPVCASLPEVVAPAAAPNWRVLVNVATVWSKTPYSIHIIRSPRKDGIGTSVAWKGRT